MNPDLSSRINRAFPKGDTMTTSAPKRLPKGYRPPGFYESLHEPITRWLRTARTEDLRIAPEMFEQLIVAELAARADRRSL